MRKFMYVGWLVFRVRFAFRVSRSGAVCLKGKRSEKKEGKKKAKAGASYQKSPKSKIPPP
jgi:hypothetical protein